MAKSKGEDHSGTYLAVYFAGPDRKDENKGIRTARHRSKHERYSPGDPGGIKINLPHRLSIISADLTVLLACIYGYTR